MSTEEIFDEKTMAAFNSGYKSSVELMEMTLTEMIIDIEAQTTLEKAAYLSLYTPLLDRLLELSVISEAKHRELSIQLNKNNPKSLCVFDPEIDCDTGEKIKNGQTKLFSWDTE